MFKTAEFENAILTGQTCWVPVPELDKWISPDDPGRRAVDMDRLMFWGLNYGGPIDGESVAHVLCKSLTSRELHVCHMARKYDSALIIARTVLRRGTTAAAALKELEAIASGDPDETETPELKFEIEAVRLGVVSEDGTRVFNIDQVEKLSEHYPYVITRLSQEVMRLTGEGPKMGE